MSIETNTNVEQAGNLASEVGSVIANRNGTHGDPVENHDHIAELWNAYLGVYDPFEGEGGNEVLQRPIRGDEVADMMILLKLSRKHVGGMDLDHYRDAIGYAAIGSLYVPDDQDNAERLD
jgi:hypothetical protein